MHSPSIENGRSATMSPGPETDELDGGVASRSLTAEAISPVTGSSGMSIVALGDGAADASDVGVLGGAELSDRVSVAAVQPRSTRAEAAEMTAVATSRRDVLIPPR